MTRPGANMGSFGLTFTFSLERSALDHTATAPPLLIISVFNTSMFAYVDDNEIKVALHYGDHPIAATSDDFLSLNVGSVTLVKLSFEEVKFFLTPFLPNNALILLAPQMALLGFPMLPLPIVSYMQVN